MEPPETNPPVDLLYLRAAPLTFAGIRTTTHLPSPHPICVDVTQCRRHRLGSTPIDRLRGLDPRELPFAQAGRWPMAG